MDVKNPVIKPSDAKSLKTAAELREAVGALLTDDGVSFSPWRRNVFLF